MSEDRADVGGFEHAQGFVAGEISGSLGLGPLEMQYEELFADALADGVITAEERSRLEKAADNLDRGRSNDAAEVGDRLQVSDSLLKSLQRPKSR